MMKRVAFTAQAFGFGPVAKMLAISESLRGVEKVFFGSGLAHDLAKLHFFDEVHYLEHGDRFQIESILQKSDLLINVMDFELAPLSIKAKCPYFLVDSLLWFWSELPAGVHQAEIYFCQNFFGLVEEKIQKYRIKNAQIIGPITYDHYRRLPVVDQVMVNFGGLENPFVEIGRNSNYPFVILENLLPILEGRFSRILVTGRGRVMEMCRMLFGENGSLKFAMLDNIGMLEELHRSQALFTAPGIQSFYDAYDKVPIFCLPPQNNSNARNLDILVSQGAIQFYLQWKDLYDFHIPMGNGREKEEIDEILRAVQLFETDQTGRSIFRERVKHFLERSHAWPHLINTQKEQVALLGESGTRSICQAIREKLQGGDLPKASLGEKKEVKCIYRNDLK